MQHWKLTLRCGHSFETSGVDEHEGKPFAPNYVGKVIPRPPVRCCFGDHTALVQRKISGLTGREDDPDPIVPPEVAAARAFAEYGTPEVPPPGGKPLSIR